MIKTRNHNTRKAINLFKNSRRILRTSEILASGIHPRTLYKLRDDGIIMQVGRGLYKLNDHQLLSNPDLVIVTAHIPTAKICLLSSLDFHGMTSEIPHKVHIAISRTQRNPVLDYPPIEVYRFTGESLIEGIEKHTIDGQVVQIYNPAKTIADCFKFRNQIGKEIAIEALREGIGQGKASYKDILHYAEICRVKSVIKPYLEMVIHE